MKLPNQSLQKAAVLPETDGVASYNLGVAFDKLGRDQEAFSAYQQSIKINAKLAQAHYNLGITLGKLSRWDDAVLSYQKSLATKPDDANAHYNLGLAYSELGNWNAAIDALKP